MSMDHPAELHSAATEPPQVELGADVEDRPLTHAQIAAYAIPQIAVNFSGTLMTQWLTYYYLPPATPEGASRTALVGTAVFAFLMFAGRLVDAVSDPLIGHWSDRARFKSGRRKPFVFAGTPFLALAFVALWFPPAASAGAANHVFLAAALALYWFAFTVVLGPYSALMPEIAKTHAERMVISSTSAIFGAVGIILAQPVGPLLSKYPEGLEVGGRVLSMFQIFALIGGVMLLVSVIPMLRLIRETRFDASKEISETLVDSVVSSMKNSAFRAFLGLSAWVQTGIQVFTIVLPFFCSQVLERSENEAGLVKPGQGETWTAIVFVIVFLGGLFWIPVIQSLAEKLGNKVLMFRAGIFAGCIFASLPLVELFPDPAIPTLFLVALLSFPVGVGTILASVLFAEVIDIDAAQTGKRREGIYNGASSLLSKSAVGLASLMVALLLSLGNSRANPLGIYLSAIVAGALVFIGMFVFRKFPQR